MGNIYFQIRIKGRKLGTLALEDILRILNLDKHSSSINVQ